MTERKKFLREQDAANVIRVVEVLKSIKGPKSSLSLAINSRDGNGKTYFIKWLIDYIPTQSNCRDKTIYYNAEECDDFEDPFVPLAYNIISTVDCDENINFVEYTKAFLTACGCALLKDGINSILGLNFGDIVSEGIDAVQDAEIKNIFEKFNSYFKRREHLSEKIEDIVPSDGKLWIFIDELDKCRPEYVIKMLEIIKHYFSIPNIVFVVSVDLDMLSYALKNVYGQKYDVNTFVRHYFDYIYNPIEINWSQYIDNKIQEYNMQDILKKNNRLFIISVFRNWKFSIKEAENCFNNILYFFNFYKFEMDNLSQEALMIYLYFLFLKFKFNYEYIRILHGEYIIENTKKAKYKKLDLLLRVNSHIISVLKDLANGKANEHTSDLIKKYHLLNIKNVSSFSQNIEIVLSYNIEYDTEKENEGLT